MLVSVVTLLGTELHIDDDDAEIRLCDTSDKKMWTSVAIKVALESLYKIYFGTIISISCEFGKDFLVVQTTGLKLLEWKFWSYQYMYCVCTILLIWNLGFLW